MNYKLQFNDHEQQGGNIVTDVPALLFMPVSVIWLATELSTRHIPAAPLRSQKKPVSPESEHGPGILPHGRISRLISDRLRHKAAQFVCSFDLHLHGSVSVGIQSEARAVVPQHGGQGLYIHSVLERQCCEGMA